MKRETFFRCTFSSDRRRQVAHVTAWDTKDAAQLFEAELRTEGVEERGTIEVTASGGLTRRSVYRAGASPAHAGL